MIAFSLALRYLKGRNRFWFSTVNLLSFSGIVLGVFSLLVVSSVMNGLSADMRNRIIGSKAEIMVHNADFSPISNYRKLTTKIEKNPDVIAAASVCESELMINKDNNISATICLGIEPEKYDKITNIFDKIVVGNFENEDLAEGIILGLELSLTLNATVGEEIVLSSPIGTKPSPFGLLPETKRLKVVGIFSSGLPEFDRVYTFISLQNGQLFLGKNDAVGHIAVKTKNVRKSHLAAKKLQKNLYQKFKVEDWRQFEANLFNAIKMEKAVMFTVLALMIIIAAFNMAGNFIKLVAEKRTDIGILKGLGAPQKLVQNIFVTMGIVIGSMGAIFGMVLALILLNLQQKYHFVKIPISGLPIHWLPVEIKLSDFIFVPLLVLFISLLTTFYPSRKTLKIKPIEIIQNR